MKDNAEEKFRYTCKRSSIGPLDDIFSSRAACKNQMRESIVK